MLVLGREIMRFLPPQNTGIPTELLTSIYYIASQLKETTLMRFERSRLSAPQDKIDSNSREQVRISAGIADYRWHLNSKVEVEPFVVSYVVSLT
jgi:hypothetical protein